MVFNPSRSARTMSFASKSRMRAISSTNGKDRGLRCQPVRPWRGQSRKKLIRFTIPWGAGGGGIDPIPTLMHECSAVNPRILPEVRLGSGPTSLADGEGRSGYSRRFRDVRDEVRFSPDSGKIAALQRTTLKIRSGRQLRIIAQSCAGRRKPTPLALNRLWRRNGLSGLAASVGTPRRAPIFFHPESNEAVGNVRLAQPHNIAASNGS